MSEYKTFSNNEYPKVGEVCMVLRTKILDESTGKVGPTESFFGKFSIEDGIPYWGAGHRCKPIDQWKLVEFEASPKTQAEPPADPNEFTETTFGYATVRCYHDGRTETLYGGKVFSANPKEAQLHTKVLTDHAIQTLLDLLPLHFADLAVSDEIIRIGQGRHARIRVLPKLQLGTKHHTTHPRHTTPSALTTRHGHTALSHVRCEQTNLGGTGSPGEPGGAVAITTPENKDTTWPNSTRDEPSTNERNAKRAQGPVSPTPYVLLRSKKTR